MGLYTIHLFAGAGGGILADLLLRHTPIGACELEDYPRRVLLQRQLDGVLPVFPVWDDITTLRADNSDCAEAFAEWRSIRDQLCICGGFPCQDISAAGRGEGIAGARSGLWSEFARIIREIRPRYAFVENSPMLTLRGLGTVLEDLAAMGFDARWGVLSAADAIWRAGDPCADHLRERMWIAARAVPDAAGRGGGWGVAGSGEEAGRRAHTEVEGCGARNPEAVANADGQRRAKGRTEQDVWPWELEPVRCGCEVSDADEQHGDGGGHGAGEVCGELREKAELPGGKAVGDAGSERGEEPTRGEEKSAAHGWPGNAGWWCTEPGVGRVAHGVAHRVDRIKALGNGQVPQVAALAWETLNDA